MLVRNVGKKNKSKTVNLITTDTNKKNKNLFETEEPDFSTKEKTENYFTNTTEVNKKENSTTIDSIEQNSKAKKEQESPKSTKKSSSIESNENVIISVPSNAVNFSRPNRFSLLETEKENEETKQRSNIKTLKNHKKKKDTKEDEESDDDEEKIHQKENKSTNNKKKKKNVQKNIEDDGKTQSQKEINNKY